MYYYILNFLAVIVAAVFIVCTFIKCKHIILIGCTASGFMLIINIVVLIMEIDRNNIGYNIISIIVFIFLWIEIIVIFAIYFVLEFIKKIKEEDKKKLQEIEKSLSEVKSNDARIIYEAYFGPKVEHTEDTFSDGKE